MNQRKEPNSIYTKLKDYTKDPSAVQWKKKLTTCYIFVVIRPSLRSPTIIHSTSWKAECRMVIAFIESEKGTKSIHTLQHSSAALD